MRCYEVAEGGGEGNGDGERSSPVAVGSDDGVRDIRNLTPQPKLRIMSARPCLASMVSATHLLWWVGVAALGV